MKTSVTFRSNAFPPVKNDTVNAPMRYGKKLAQWLAAELPAHGLAVIDCYDEDWGWEIELANADFPLRLGCGNVDEEAKAGKAAAFCCFIVSPNKKYTALARLAVLLVLSAARCLVSFLFGLTIAVDRRIMGLRWRFQTDWQRRSK